MANSKEYMRVYVAKRRRARRLELIQLFGGCCYRCKAVDSLHFDHVVPETSNFKLSGCGLDKPWVSIVKEAAKCQLLCSKCHKAKTLELHEHVGGWNRGISRRSKTPAHGTPVRYSEFGCRCEMCRQAKRKYRKGEMPYVGSEYVPITKQRVTQFLEKKRKSNRSKRGRIQSVSITFDLTKALSSKHARKPKTEKFCACGKKLLRKSLVFCSSKCKNLYKQPTKRSRRPKESVLLKVTSSMSMVAAGKYFGVSDNGVRKWLKSYGHL